MSITAHAVSPLQSVCTDERFMACGLLDLLAAKLLQGINERLQLHRLGLDHDTLHEMCNPQSCGPKPTESNACR